jgi:hypothetical protein
VAKIYPRPLGSLSDASYDSQSYGGGILSCLNRGNSAVELKTHNLLLMYPRHGPHRKHLSQQFRYITRLSPVPRRAHYSSIAIYSHYLRTTVFTESLLSNRRTCYCLFNFLLCIITAKSDSFLCNVHSHAVLAYRLYWSLV